MKGKPRFLIHLFNFTRSSGLTADLLLTYMDHYMSNQILPTVSSEELGPDDPPTSLAFLPLHKVTGGNFDFL